LGAEGGVTVCDFARAWADLKRGAGHGAAGVSGRFIEACESAAGSEYPNGG
jgi:hypothetical protein